MTTHKNFQLTLTFALVIFSAQTLWAVPTQVTHEDQANCDTLLVPEDVHELGIAPLFSQFPTELISAVSTFTNDAACPLTDDAQTPNRLVQMTNLTGLAWSDVWYVADPGTAPGSPFTSISNYDGLVDVLGGQIAGQAFKIDTVGVNTPLVFESIAANGIFEPGETWQFIVQDYVNAGALLPEAFDSVGVGSASGGGPPSSGSIIAAEVVPEPSSLALLGLGAITLLFGWRKRASAK